MKKIFATVCLTILALLVLIVSCSDESELPTTPISNESNLTLMKGGNYVPTMDDVVEIARSLSILLNQESYRQLFEEEIKSSEFVENIIEAKSLFEKFNENSKHDILKDMAEYIRGKKKSEFVSNMKALKFGLVDIYFPYKEDRANWNASMDIIVVPVNSCILKNQTSIEAFKMGGESIYVSTSEKPSVPALVVTPSEKNGRYSKKTISDEIALDEAKFLSLESEDPTPITYYRTYIRKFRIDEQYDGGMCGDDMEIYFKYRYRINGGTWSSWSSTGTYDAEPEEEQEIYKLIKSVNRSDYEYEIEIWEDDDWLCGADDEVCIGSYDNSFLGYDPTYPTFEGSNITYFPWTEDDRYINEFDTPTESNNVWFYHNTYTIWVY